MASSEAMEIREGSPVWLRAYVGVDGVDMIYSTKPRDIIDIWRDVHTSGLGLTTHAIVQKELLDLRYIIVDLTEFSWSSVARKFKNCVVVRDLDQAIMVCKMVR